jgi:ergothioneine biosynthesis protein EgtB
MSALPQPLQTGVRQERLLARAREVSAATLHLLDGLSPEDCMLQSMQDASPLKWHVGHVTWFFETFLLENGRAEFAPFDPTFRELFNSYYVGVGARHPRGERGMLSRPPLERVLAYQYSVHHQLFEWMASTPLSDDALDLIELGIHHQQQHQELMVTDLKHHFSRNPAYPAYRPEQGVAREAAAIGIASAATAQRPPASIKAPLRFIDMPGGLVEIGSQGEGFSFDNERPRHPYWLQPYALASRPVNNADYLAFMLDGGYASSEWWLSEGWDVCQREGWQAPLYWVRQDATWLAFTAQGLSPIDGNAPVCHLSYFEADAFARWAGARLPTEQEWEAAAAQVDPATAAGDFAEDNHFHPRALSAADADVSTGFQGLYGGVWEWTQSAYLPYPGFRIAEGAVGEYNGKFMINQMVLRGGSCATPRSHIRGTYRNFFPTSARWQFSGLRLAR